MKWWLTVLTLCTYGMLKEFKPSEPYLYRYQQNYLNISGAVLNAEVYPYWTYSYLVFLIPVLLLTDVLLYKPVLILESLSYIAVWVSLIFGRGVLSQQVGQVIYGFATATEVAYFAYVYVKVDRSKYASVTVWTRAALQTGKCLAYFFSQLVIMYEWGDLLTLNYISLVSVSLTLFFAVALPFVDWREVVTQLQIAKNKDESSSLQKQLPHTYCKFVTGRFREFSLQVRTIFSDSRILKWSLCWCLTSCGNLQVGNYIQSLWGEAQKDVHNVKIYNGFVEGAIPLLSALTLLSLRIPKVDWDKWGEICLSLAAFTEFAIILGMSAAENIYFMYAGFAVFRIFYQCMITIAQFNIACLILTNSMGFVFGLNMFASLALQTAITFVVVDGRGLALPIRTQFVVYSCYHFCIAVLFLALFSYRKLCSRKVREENVTQL